MELSPGHGPDLTEKLFGGGIADEKKAAGTPGGPGGAGGAGNPTPPANPVLYVSNYYSDTVGVAPADYTTPQTPIFLDAGEAGISDNPYAVAVDDKGNAIYVSGGLPAVYVIDPATNEIVDTFIDFAGSDGLEGLAVNPADGYVWVASKGDSYGSMISVIDPETGEVIANICADGCEYSDSFDPGALGPDANETIATIDVGSDPGGASGVAVSPGWTRFRFLLTSCDLSQ
jgi:DNA-binding beta-propeller fold protein YncE